MRLMTWLNDSNTKLHAGKRIRHQALLLVKPGQGSSPKLPQLEKWKGNQTWMGFQDNTSLSLDKLIVVEISFFLRSIFVSLVCAKASSVKTPLVPKFLGVVAKELRVETKGYNLEAKGPSIPTNPSPKKVVERETEVTTDKEQTKFQGSTAHIPPPVIPIPIPEPDVPKTLPKTTPIPEPDVPKNLPKPNIPYPSRLNQEKSRDKASNQKEKIFQMFHRFAFDISYRGSLLLSQDFTPTLRVYS
ncbi:hypothetical protein Tco_1408857 [Tanacetum coccineum]